MVMKSYLFFPLWAVVASAAQGASVTLVDGGVDLTLEPFTSSGGPASAQFDVQLEETQARSLVGHGGEGLAEVEYAAFLTEGGADLNVRAVARSGGAFNDGGLATSVFSITFSLDEATDYWFQAEVETGPFDFRALLDDEEASASVDLLGEFSGTLPTIDDEGGSPVGFGTFVSVGTLAAGTHTFSVSVSGGLSRSFDGLDTEGFARLTLGESPTLIPTPAASLLGVATLLGLIARRRPRAS